MDGIKNFRIDPDRLWGSLMEMAKIGPGTAGGNNRQTLTDEDAEGRALFETWCKNAGMTIGVDKIGNMFATRPVRTHQHFQYTLDLILIHSQLEESTTVF